MDLLSTGEDSLPVLWKLNWPDEKKYTYKKQTPKQQNSSSKTVSKANSKLIAHSCFMLTSARFPPERINYCLATEITDMLAEWRPFHTHHLPEL